MNLWGERGGGGVVKVCIWKMEGGIMNGWELLIDVAARNIYMGMKIDPVFRDQ